MRIIIQRVSQAAVQVEGEAVGSINKGLLLLVGIENADTPGDVEWLVQKIVQMRIFSDAEGKMNLSLQDVGGEVLIISQFTLHAQTKKGNRPSFIKAAPPAVAIPLYELFIAKMQQADVKKVAQGIFGADMQVQLTNDGPVTIWIDSQQKE
ncbi:MAG: D-aminoacyl-tRNA deacylase [Chitinophagales bacterium]|nr:D-tyrosyl-tRNA(Tyr) deacylase [Bacteroidota bacterium]MCB9043800.1 D-tyrosyl-tRNA(Tyr) deacylase [Chitinophagales bacterium]